MLLTFTVQLQSKASFLPRLPTPRNTDKTTTKQMETLAFFNKRLRNPDLKTVSSRSLANPKARTTWSGQVSCSLFFNHFQILLLTSVRTIFCGRSSQDRCASSRSTHSPTSIWERAIRSSNTPEFHAESEPGYTHNAIETTPSQTTGCSVLRQSRA